MPKKILKEVELVHGDIRDADFIRNNLSNVKCVLNLAALIGIPYSYHAPSSYFNTNVMGLMNILNACKDKNISIIHTSLVKYTEQLSKFQLMKIILYRLNLLLGK